jgi:hypothetical protein
MSGCKLYAGTTHLPSVSGVFTEIYDFGEVTLEPISIAVLNDRAVIACGNMHKPLVFLGGLDASGADWAVPKAAIVSYDSGASWHDIGPQVLDPDPATFMSLDDLLPGSGMIAICTDVSGVQGFSFDASGQLQSGVVKIEGYSGAWGDWSGVGFSDGTASGGRPFAQSGVATLNSSNIFTTTYHTIFEQPGYWHRVSFPSGCSGGELTRILFQAPCQDLQVIGDGQPVRPLGFIYHDTSMNSAKDWTVQVSDYTIPSVARLNDGASSGAVGMQPGDYIYVGYLSKFDQMRWTPGNDNPNTSGASGFLEYWNGNSWSSLAFSDGTQASGLMGTVSVASGGSGYVSGDVLTVVDGVGTGGTVTVTSINSGTGLVSGVSITTAGQNFSSGYHSTSGSTSGSGCILNLTAVINSATLAQKGFMSWASPADWRETRPISPSQQRGFWVRFFVNSNLRVDTYIAECELLPIPEAMTNYKYACTIRDRVVLLNRPDAPDQLGITRALEEYGMTGSDSYSLRVGGQDEIVGAVELFNQVFLGKTDCIQILNGYNPATFAAERAETGGQAPISNRVMAAASIAEADSKNKMGLYYLNQFGAWAFTGLQVYKLSAEVNWWDPTADNPRIDLEYLWRACGIFWPERSWVIWAVPFITGENVSQTTNNYLIIYDLQLGTWLPPVPYPAASMCLAYHYADDAPAHRGEVGLYAGGYSGGIARIFSPTADRGNGWAVTGWMPHGGPKFQKLLRHLTAYGKGDITIKIYADGDASTIIKQPDVSELASIGAKLFAVEQENVNMQARFFKYRVDLAGDTDLYGLGLEFASVRGWNKA